MKPTLAMLLLFLLIGCFCLRDGGAKELKRCLGTNFGYSIAEDRMDHFRSLVIRYTDCTIVQGNLEITGLEGPDIDASFLKDIEVVTGYVLIAVNFVSEIPLPNLKIIRGQELYNSKKAALAIFLNHNGNFGLKRIKFKSLSEIQQGNVWISQSKDLCFVDTINWHDIINPAARKRYGLNVTMESTAHDCPKCHEACNGHCWGPGPDDCQNLTSTICDPDCGDTRCRGPGRDDCCDRECACGCTGPTDRDCIVCLHMNNSGVCQSSCPQRFTYDSQSSRYVPNPDFKYHFNEMCVDQCPSNVLVEDNGCVKHCRKGQHNNGSGFCVPCNGNECNRECFGVGHPDGPLNGSETVDAKNVHFFEGCNIVRGNIIFEVYAFQGDDHMGTPPMRAEQIKKAFSGVKIINGFLKILSWPDILDDFSVFANLTTIIGIDLYRGVVSLLVQDGITDEGPFHLSQVKSLGFRSLTSITYGNVYIGYMKSLCYQNLVNWEQIIRNPIEHRSFRKGLLLRENSANCENKTCPAFCDRNGCWGPSSVDCLGCKSIEYNAACYGQCNRSLGIYQHNDTTCLPCHSECTDTCDGAGQEKCTSCRNYKDGDKCVQTCPFKKYGDPYTKECLPCNETCAGQYGKIGPRCSGPNTTLGLGGCEFCHTIVADRNLRSQRCLPMSQTKCPEAHYIYENVGLKGTERACVPCAQDCRNCTGSTENDCLHALPVRSETVIVMTVVVSIVLIGLICLAVFLVHHRRQKLRRKREMSMRALGLEGGSQEPMTPSGVAPNQAQLRIVKETDLRIGKILGSGAFGTVHNGYWMPDLTPKEKVRVPVAIKVLRDQSSQVASNEILDEAFVMASCEHPNLVQLLGISLSHKIMLITQLMPLGNLLEYVRDNKDNVGSQTLLNWCLQIAKGMCYLAEEKHLVHRDLAARNVLVKSPNHVRITDFGLAKLLDVNEDVYRAEGGKMPIKWLALESIQQRVFTQKSDVWSFGVTVWELLTFGKKPYENVPAREVHTLLQRGERLLQPARCTIDVYMLMIKCWTVDPDSRPTFRELVDEFSRMARDPQRYLVIANDSNLPELPSPTASDFFRSLKYEEGDDFPLQNVEDYLQPGNSASEQTSAKHGHFSLQPAPTRAQWKRREERLRPVGYPSRFRGSQSSSHADNRLDSSVTAMTSLPSESLHSCRTSFSQGTPGTSATPNWTENSFPAFASRDQVSGASGVSGRHLPTKGPRTASESSDVFISGPSTQLKDAWNMASARPCAIVHRGTVRERENSATMRYCAEPILVGQRQSAPYEMQNRRNDNLREDEDGYLEPSDAKVYLSPVSHLDSSPYFARDPRRRNPTSEKLSPGVENPDYQPTFMPGRDGGFVAGSHNLIGRQCSIPVTEDDGYEVPMPGGDMFCLPERRLSTEYENVKHGTGDPDSSGNLEKDEHGYLAVNRIMSERRRNSHSGESSSSGKQDSGMQSEAEEEAASFECDVTSHVTTKELSVGNHVDNMSYERLEDMTDGGFKPVPDIKSDAVALPKSRKNPLQLTIDCDACGDLEDNIFVTPETRRRGTINVKTLVGLDNGDDLFATPETMRRNLGKLTSEYDVVTGRFVPRTYSVPDSGVGGVEFGIDNAMYHRLGSSGWEASD